MADGYEVIVKINLPPEKQYHSGHSVIVQGHSVGEVEKLLDALCGTEGNGKVILAQFGEFALAGGATAVLSKGSGAAASTPAASEDTSQPAAAGEEPASEALLKAIAKKHGVDLEDLKGRGLTKPEAQRLLKEGVK